MGTPTILVIAIALAIDAFSVAASVGPRCSRLGALRLAISFGAFQAGMPLLGILMGTYLYRYVRDYDHWVAFGLLSLVGMRMVVEALRRHPADGASQPSFDPSHGVPLLGLSIATSIDALGAGMGMRMVGADFWLASPVIGSITFGLTYLGGVLGVAAERYVGPKAELVGGLVLIGLGVRMLRI